MTARRVDLCRRSPHDPLSGPSAPSEAEIAAATGAHSIYVHVPFCRSRCDYCAFVTTTLPEAAPLAQSRLRKAYVDAVTAEVSGRGPKEPRRVQSLYFGGGTPSLLHPSELAEILEALRARFVWDLDTECTIEANPEDLTEDMVASIQELGFNRVSIGLQSTERTSCEALGRPHAPETALSAARRCVAAGLRTSLDLIGGAPGAPLDDLRRSVEAALETGIRHLSMYLLSVERGTPLAERIRRGEVPEPSDDTARRSYQFVDDLLTSRGWSWYELSNWAAEPADRSTHNLAYWKGESWWGFGPGAHSHLAGPSAARRWWNTSNIDRYLRGTTCVGEEALTPEQRHLESLMLGIRLVEGIDPSRFDIDQERIDALADEGLLINADDRVWLTQRGRLLADSVILRLCS